MISTVSGTPRNVKDMVTYFEKRRDHPVHTAPRRRKISMAAMMSLTRRPWEHFPRRKSSASTDPRRRSSTSTRSNSTSYDLAEEYISEPGYAASERSGTSTVVSEDRRRSANPDYDWEHDSIADLKASLNSIDLSSTANGSLLKGTEATSELHKVDSAGLEDKSARNGVPGVHEIDFVDPSAPRTPRTASDESRPDPAKENSFIPNEQVEHVSASHSAALRDGIAESELATKSAAVESKASETADSSQQFIEAKIPIRKSSAKAPGKAGQLRVKTGQPDKDRKGIDATSPKSPNSPNSPSPKTKSRPKLALDLPGIPESEGETLGRHLHHRRPSLSMIQPLPSQRQAMHVNKGSRPPVSLKRYPVRSISAPLPGQPPASPREMMELVNQRHVKFTNIREEKLRRLSSITNTPGASRPGSQMGRRHASAPVSDAAARKRQRRRSGPVPPSLGKRLSFSQRRQSFAQAIKEYVRSPRRRPSWFMKRTRSVTR